MALPRKKQTKARRASTGLACKDKHLTNQSHKDSADINRVLQRAKHGASLSHLANYQGEYGDFSGINERTWEDMLNTQSRALTIFNDLPAALRDEFENNPGKFFGFVNDPANADRLDEIFPALAEPGLQFPDVVGGLKDAVVEGITSALATPVETPENASEEA